MSEFSDDHVYTPGSFGWSHRYADGVEMIALAGELDLAAASGLRMRLMRVVESSTADRIVIDLSDVEFIDAQCAGVIVAAWDTAMCDGRQLRVDGLHDLPATVFELLGLTPIVSPGTAPGDGGRGSDDRGGRAGRSRRRPFVGGTHATG